MGEQADCDRHYHSIGESGASMISELNDFAYRLKANECLHGTTLCELYPENVDARSAHLDVDVPRPHFRSGEPCGYA